MDIQIRKLNLIEEFLHISDENLIKKLETVLKNQRKKISENQSKPMSLSDFNEMINLSESDVEKGNIISHDDLLRKVKSWK